MKSDLEIARSIQPSPIEEIAAQYGIQADELIPHGRTKAKVDASILKRLEASGRPVGKYISVTAITPTPLGEGKTVTTIGLGHPLYLSVTLGHTAR